jgi:pimeloyl-ACP methyl ester carboxylesterase
MPFFFRENLRFHYLDLGLNPGGELRDSHERSAGLPACASPDRRPALLSSGQDSGVPFFFQHGLGGDSERVFALVEPPPGFRLFGLDCRGHGKTTPLGEVERLGFDSFADDLVALMDHLNLSQAIIGGTSMGAGVALNCALRHPERVRGLVLLRPAWLDGPMLENARVFGFIARLIREHDPQRGAEIFKQSETCSSISTESPDAVNSLLELFVHPRAVETVAKLERLPQDAPNRDRAQWRRIRVPALVLANRRDSIHPFEYGTTLAREIPGAQFAELTPKSASVSQYTRDFRRHLGEFLRAHFA